MVSRLTILQNIAVLNMPVQVKEKRNLKMEIVELFSMVKERFFCTVYIKKLFPSSKKL